MAGVAVALAVLAASLTAGCSALPVRTVDLPLPPPAVVFDAWPGCQQTVPDLELNQPNERSDRGRVPDDFVPEAAVRCGEDWSSADVRRGVEQRTTAIAPLVEVLAQPSQDEARISGEVSCTADAWLPPWLFLVDAQGRWMTAQIPLDVCGKPRDRDVFDTSSWAVVRTWALEPG